MKIKTFDYELSIVKLKDVKDIDTKIGFYFLAKTNDEISLVIKSEDVPETAIYREDGYKAFRIDGELDFSLVGILADITSVLAENKIPVFAVSTFNTDYILVKSEFFDKALRLMQDNGYVIE